MSTLNFSIDLHCHPQYKPFGRAHKVDGAPPEPQGKNASARSSLWFYDPPSLIDKGLQIVFGVTKFSQTNLTASLYGRNLVMAVGLGATEQGFLKNKLGEGLISDLGGQFVSGFGRARVNAIQGMKDYWADFKNEMKFMEEGENKVVTIDGHFYKYSLPKNFLELQDNIAANEDPDAGTSSAKPLIVSLICAVEGLHALNCGLETPCDPNEVLQHAKELKSLPHAPWFITFSHHFYNELCGHARSLRNEIGKLVNQEKGISSGFTALGEQVLDVLLDKTTGRRILIDMKHMSPIGRKRFLQLRSEKYNNEIPIFMSHGVCNGLPTHGATFSNFPELGNSFINELSGEIGGDGQFKDHNQINFYDDEILAMVNSQGVIGLQLDEKRLANDETIKHRIKHSLFRHKIMHYRSELVWNQIQYIAELLDHHNLFAWDNMAIGSDYDGIVDPLNAFWTTEEFDDLAGFLERHAHNYFENKSSRLKNEFNKIGADRVIQKVFSENAWTFLRRWF